MNRMLSVAVGFFLVASLSGCAFVFQKGRRSDIEKIQELSKQLDEFEQTKRLLEQRLKQEQAGPIGKGGERISHYLCCGCLV
jgi:hypothetical protein